ncbi:MAG TPA: sulfotransferase [Rhizomicrobium sp.]
MSVSTAIDGGNGASLLGHARALRDAGRDAEALEAFARAAQLPSCPVEAFLDAAVLSARLGRPSDAAAWLQRGAAAHPDRHEPFFFRGCMLVSQNRYADAVEQLRRALALQSPNLDATKPLIFALRRLSRFAEATAAAQDWARDFPRDPEAQATLAHIAREQNLLDEALAHARRAEALAPQVVDWSILVSRALVDLGRADQAAAELKAAAAREPDKAAVQIHLANVLKVAGDFGQAREALRRAAELAPDELSVFYELADITKFTANDPLAARMDALANAASVTPAGIPPPFHFALGKMNDDLGRTERAFFHFAAGNAMERRQNRYDEAATLGAFERMQRIFSQDAIARLGGGGAASEMPIFLVGMPRSGSTLLEQILVSHPAVSAAGEVPYLPQAVSEVLESGPTFGESLHELTREKSGEIGRHYLARLERHAAGLPKVTDKLLANALLVGVIHLAMPHARIVHCVRDPVDTCLSCFMKPFGTRMPFSNDLQTLGRYYRAHAALMAHWQAVLPPGSILQMRYEDVVADVESAARRLIAHCGLDWDDRCVAFHQTRRPVNTASMAQVREPIYGGAVGRWRRYEAQLGPLLHALRDLAH